MILFYFFAICVLSLIQYYIVVLSRDTELKILFEKLIFKILFLIVFIWLFYIALNKEIGIANNDTNNYIKAFQLLSDSIYDYRGSSYRLLINALIFEPLYVFIMQIWYSLISDNGLYFVSILTIISIFLTFNFFRQNTELYWMAMLLYSSHFLWAKDFNQLRNALASAIVWYLPAMWCNKRYVKFYGLLIVAILIQSASVFVLFALLLNKVLHKFLINRYKYILLLSFCIILYLSHFGDFVLKEMFAKISTHIAAYLYRANDIADRGIFTNPVVLKGVFFSLVLISVRKDLVELNMNNGCYIDLYIIGVLWIVVFSNIGLFANRFASYVTGFENLLLAEVVHINKRQLTIFNVDIRSILMFILLLMLASSQFYVDSSALLTPQL